MLQIGAELYGDANIDADLAAAFEVVGLVGGDVVHRQHVGVGDVAGGFAMMMQTVLPWFNLGNAAVSVGLAASAHASALTHVGGTRLEHLGESLAELPTMVLLVR